MRTTINKKELILTELTNACTELEREHEKRPWDDLAVGSSLAHHQGGSDGMSGPQNPLSDDTRPIGPRIGMADGAPLKYTTVSQEGRL